MTSPVVNDATLGTGLLIARLVLGFLMAGHGAQKLLGWFGGYGLAGTAGFMEGLGFRPGRVFATAAAVTEIVGGLLVVLGFLDPIGPALMLSVMIVAAISAHWKNGVFAISNGIEVPLLYAVGAFALALTGPGPFSLDALLGLDTLWTPGAIWVVVGAGVLGGIANLGMRQPVPPQSAA